MAYKGELPKNRRESEPNPRESRALSPYGLHTTGHYRGPTEGNYRKTTGKVNHIPTNPGHFVVSPYGPYTAKHYRWPTKGNYRKTAGKVNQIPANPGHFPPMVHTLQGTIGALQVNQIPANPGHFPLWSTHYKALQVPYTGELPENRRESEPNPHESRALSPYGPHTTRHYRCPTQGNHRKTAGKVNHIPTNPGHFPPATFQYKGYTSHPQPRPPKKKVKGYGIRKQRSSCLKDILNWNIGLVDKIHDGTRINIS